MRISKSAMTASLLVFIVAFAVIVCESLRVSAQGPTPTLTVTPALTATLTPTLTVAPTTVATPIPTEDASERIFGLYGDAIETSSRTIEAVKWGMTVVFTVVTLIVGLSGGYTIYQSKAAQDRASEANTKASEANAKAIEANVMASMAQKLLERAEEKAAKAQDTVGELRLEANKLDQNVHNAQRSIQELAEFAGKVQSQVEDISGGLTVIGQQAEELQRALGIFDQGDLHFLATLRLIDRYRRILLVTDDPKKGKQAEWALLEKSHADSPLIRRESVIALAGIGEPSEAVIERFEEIVAEEDDPEVKRLAKEALETWQSTHREAQETG